MGTFIFDSISRGFLLVRQEALSLRCTAFSGDRLKLAAAHLGSISFLSFVLLKSVSPRNGFPASSRVLRQHLKTCAYNNFASHFKDKYRRQCRASFAPFWEISTEILKESQARVP